MSDLRITAARHILAIIPPVMRTLAAELRRTGDMLSPSHFGVLVILAYHPCNLSELADEQGVSLPTMSSTVARLEKRGWIKRSRSQEDRRVVMVSLTPEGERKLDVIRLQAEARLMAMLEVVSAADQEALVAGLSVLRDIFDVSEADFTDGNPTRPSC